MINRAPVQGDELGEDMVMGSVVYMGRGSFRMETVVESLVDSLGDDGAPREVTGVVTSPYRTRGETHDPVDVMARLDEDATQIIARARTGQWRDEQAFTPELPAALFGSAELPMLTAPTERLVASRRRGVSVSRGALAATGMLLFACGLASGAAARRSFQATKATAPTVATVTTPTVAPAPVATLPTAPAALGAATTPPVFEVPQPILVRVHKKAAAVGVSHVTHAAPSPWVDPFAD